MKDIKFIVLLLLIVFIGIANVIWLATLQVKVSNLSAAPKSKIESKAIDKLFVADLSVGMLRVLDEKCRNRIVMGTDSNEAVISIFDINNKIRFSAFAGYAYDSNMAGCIMPLQPTNLSSLDTPGIFLFTHSDDMTPRLAVIDGHGKGTTYSAIGVTQIHPD